MKPNETRRDKREHGWDARFGGGISRSIASSTNHYVILCSSSIYHQHAFIHHHQTMAQLHHPHSRGVKRTIRGLGLGRRLHAASVKCLYVLLLILHSIHCFPESMSGRVQEFLWLSIKCRSKDDPSSQLIRHLWPANWGLILRFITHVVTKQIIRMSLCK